MSVSLVKSIRRTVFLSSVLVALGSLISAHSMAQSSGPVRLLPPTFDENTPDPLAPATPQQSEEVLSAPTGISVQSLEKVDTDSTGLLDQSTGGFAADIWTNTPRDRIDVLMQVLPTDPVDPVQRDLTRRLLLTTAAVPPRTPGAGDGEADSLTLIKARHLFNLGLVEEAVALTETAPSLSESFDVQRIVVDGMLLSGDIPGACGLMTRMSLTVPLMPPYWSKIELFCKAVAGDSAAAQFGATLLAEEPTPENIQFLTLLDPFLGVNRTLPETLDQIDALSLAMIRVSNQPYPADLYLEARPPYLASMIAAGSASQDINLAATEELARSGVLSDLDLARIYQNIEFPAEALADPLAIAASQDGASARALLFQAAQTQENAVVLAELISAALAIAEPDGLGAIMAAVMKPHLMRMPTLNELWWFAGPASKALYSLGEERAARAWARVLRNVAPNNSEALEAALALWPRVALEGDKTLNPVSRDIALAWRDSIIEAQPETANGTLSRVFGVLDALDEPVPNPVWLNLLLDSETGIAQTPSFAANRAFDRARAAGAKGEIILLSLIMLGNAGPDDASTATMTDIIAALSETGLRDEARALARSAMRAYDG